MPFPQNESSHKAKALATSVIKALLAELATNPYPNFASAYLAGLFTWDIFSNNHDVISPSGKIAHIGSWRGSGSTIGDILHELKAGDTGYGYLDFYMGSGFVDDLDSESRLRYYLAAMQSLKAAGGDWLCASAPYAEDVEVADLPVLVRAYVEVFTRLPEPVED